MGKLHLDSMVSILLLLWLIFVAFVSCFHVWFYGLFLGQVSQSQTGIGGAPNASSSRAGGSDNFSGAEGADYGGGGNVPEQDSAQILREKQAEVGGWVNGCEFICMFEWVD